MKKNYLIKNISTVGFYGEGFDKGDLLIEYGNDGERHVTLTDGKADKYKDGLCIVRRSGKLALPALCDIRCRIGDITRKSGGSDSELFCAAYGGYGALCPLPERMNGPDTPMMYQNYKKATGGIAYCKIIPSAYVLKKGVAPQPSDIEKIIKNGCSVFVSDESCESGMMLKIMQKIAKGDGLLICNPCDMSLVSGILGSRAAAQHGVSPIPRCAELCAAAENILLSRESGCRIHIPCVSLYETVDMIRKAKSEGIKVSASTAPQYFEFDSSEIIFRGAMAKFLPPLADARDVEAVRRGLADGTIDCICSDHTPVPESGKKDIVNGEFGCAGFETAFACGVTTLVKNETITLARLIDCMSVKPIEILTGKKMSVKSAMEYSGVILADLSQGKRYSKNNVMARVWTSVFDGMYMTGLITENFNIK